MQKSFVNSNPVFEGMHTLSLLLFFEGPFPAVFFVFKFLLSKDAWSFGVVDARYPTGCDAKPHRMRCSRVLMKVYFLKFGIPTRERNVIMFAR